MNPATGEVIAEIPRGTEEDVDERSPRRAKPSTRWFDTTPAERQSMMLKLADAIDANAEEIG